MKCSEIQDDLAVYADGRLPEMQATNVATHLDSCPVCRAAGAEILEMRSALRSMRRPDAPAFLSARIKAGLEQERKAIRSGWMPFPADVRSWLTQSVMPYGIGSVASVLIGIGLLVILSSSAGRYTQFREPERSGFLLAQDRDPWAQPTVDGVSPVAFANSRSNVASESPSINPKGALIALTRSLVRGNMKDEEVVVVADVFSDGLAQIAQVIEPSRDPNAVAELQKAFDSNQLSSPFVPAKLENRPQSMRVVLRFQTIDVKTGVKKAGRAKL
jgi:hypothetical protein